MPPCSDATTLSPAPTEHISFTKNERKEKFLTRERVLEISDPDRKCLIIIDDKIYDCTRWQMHHPGGHLTMRALCGRDATDAFRGTHHPNMWKRLDGFFYAKLQPSDIEKDDTTLAYRELTQQLIDLGYHDTDYSFYYRKMVLYGSMFGLVVAGVTLSDELWVHALSGILLGVWWQQMAFIGHDLGHNGITHDRILDSALGLVFGNLCTGIGIGWWKRSHNVHHVATNSIENDPDIQHLPIFAISPKFLEQKIFSTFFNDDLHLNKAAHVLIRYQHWLYYPVMSFARFNLYVQSIAHALGLGFYDRSEYIWKRHFQILTLVGFHSWLIALTMQLPTWQSRVIFYLLAHNVAGILHVQITCSHFSMPSYSGVTYTDSKNGHLHTQLETSLDIECHEWMDWFHGGLQFQVVHHLWPRMSRHRLRTAKKLLVQFCKERDLKYHSLSFWEANCSVIRTLKETSKSTKSFHELFKDSLNLSG